MEVERLRRLRMGCSRERGRRERRRVRRIVGGVWGGMVLLRFIHCAVGLVRERVGVGVDVGLISFEEDVVLYNL